LILDVPFYFSLRPLSKNRHTTKNLCPTTNKKTKQKEKKQNHPTSLTTKEGRERNRHINKIPPKKSPSTNPPTNNKQEKETKVIFPFQRKDPSTTIHPLSFFSFLP